MTLIVTAVAFIAFAFGGVWFLTHRSSLDERGRSERPNTYVAAGFRATISFALAGASLVIFVIVLLGDGA